MELLCVSDFHLGEKYSYLDFTHWDWKTNQKPLQPFYNGVAELDGLKREDNPEVFVETLVLLGDIFELATARIDTAAKSGRNFFKWHPN